MTREEWLMAMAQALRPAFEAAGYPLPAALRISCGWPSHRALASPGNKSRTIGQCWPAQASADGHHEVFISPCISEAAQVAAVLVHELAHAAAGCQHGHKGPFRKCARKVGLTGKMTATTATPELAERLNTLAAKIGPYPHANLDRSQAKRQNTRMLKLTCAECGYTVRTTAKWIEQGMPTCPCGEQMQEAGAA